MASLLGDKVFEISGQGPSPTKDFFQLVITKTEVTWRSWKVSLRMEFRGAAPGAETQSHADYLHDSRQQQQVGAVFGQKILQYTIALCEGHFDYLERMPHVLLLKIMSFLALDDVAKLSRTSKMFRKLCDSQEFWEQTVRNSCAKLTPDMENLATAMGWKKIFLTFFYKKEQHKHEDR